MADENIPRVDECWVWIGIDPETSEAEILGYRRGNAYVPLIALTPDHAQDNAVIARTLHADKMGSPDLYHLHFTNAEELEKLA